MIEAYAFLAVFVVQILTMSVLYPARFVTRVRAKTKELPDELFAQFSPGIDRDVVTERFLMRFRAVNTAIAFLGVLLLGWMFTYMQRPDWQEDPVVALLSVYFPIQMLPLIVVGLIGLKYRKILRNFLADGKRKAVLQRRRLFDFISPFTAFLGVLGYVAFVAFVLYFQREPFPGLALIGVLTAVYALEAVVVYVALYGRKNTPFETHTDRVHRMGQTVKSSVYGCILCVVFFSFIFTVDLLDEKQWVPFAQSLCLVISTLLCFMGLSTPPRQSEADGR